MNIAQIEQEIVDRIKEANTDTAIKIEAFPDDIRSFFSKSAKGSVLVQYRSASFSAPQALNRISQTTDIQFSVFTLHKNLHDHSGAYTLLGVVRNALLGYRIAGGSKMYLRSERFVSEQSGLWIYETIWNVQSRVVENQG